MSVSTIYQEAIDITAAMLTTVLADVDEDTLSRRPGSELNPLGFIYFHILRIWDMDLNLLIGGKPPAEDAWHRGGYTDELGYNPDGKGGRGLGIGFGYTDAEVDEVPYKLAPLQRYQEQLAAETRAYLASASDEELRREVIALGQPSTTGARIMHVVAHSWNHIGEMRLSKGLLGYPDPTTPPRAKSAS